MRAADLEPQVPYPGARNPWKSTCMQCGDVCAPTLDNVKRRGGGCVQCGRKRGGDKRSGRPSPNRLDPDEAVAVMRAADLEPQVPYPGSCKPWTSVCLKCGHDCAPTFDRVKRGSGCGQCGRKRGGEKRSGRPSPNRLDANEAVAVMRAADLDPQVPYPGAGKPWTSVCLKCGDVCAPTLTNVKRGQGCAQCGHKRAGEKRSGRPAPNRLDPDDAVAAMRAANLKPQVPYPGAGNPWKSICMKCGDVCAPTLTNVKRRGRGCISCGNQQSSDTQSTPPAEAEAEMRAAGIEPSGQYPGTRSPWKGQCLSCGRLVSPKLVNIRGGTTGCRHCGLARGGLARRVEAEAAVQVMLDAGLKPLEPYSTSNAPWKSRCLVCKRIVTPLFLNVQRRGKGCGYCAGTIVDAGEAAAFMRGLGVEPLEPYPGSHQQWRCVCTKCNTKITPSYANARRNLAACLNCATHGMSFGDPEVVYLLHHEEFQALKVGIASQVSRTDRIAHHAFKGWKAIATWSTPTGEPSRV
jgi:hypothetical protein